MVAGSQPIIVICKNKHKIPWTTLPIVKNVSHGMNNANKYLIFTPKNNL
jgi:hypothetical protein